MTTEELKKLIPKARYAKLEKEVQELTKKIEPILNALVPLVHEYEDLQKKYAKFKIEPVWITDIMIEIVRVDSPDVYNAIFKD